MRTSTSTNASRTGQVIGSAAEVYESFYLPALFQQWGGRVVDVAGIQPGQRVLDVACGTGVLARAVAERIGPNGQVIGLDINSGMLAVAQRQAAHIDWQTGRAEALPFDDNRFDAVVSQFGLMFFEDRQLALREMLRVLKPGGRLAIAVWASLADTPGYAAMVDLLDHLFGSDIADAMRAPYALGDPALLRELAREAGMLPQVITLPGTARFPSLDAWVYTDTKGWTLADVLADVQVEQLLAAAPAALGQFVRPDGSVAFPAPAHILTATKPG